ncbi:DUF1194 domain-containing protein [Sneathiella sp. CAU 1612]|uniref:DUF1194 domain-containing protein n=1 Tax=Sneathiella sedimenti TaxID=2816034 RepID=A0ABS3F392_9PROT|nr:DUF1194 domain-containing protein [Sneathiella sedimenti]MBO0332989.1 DUF1194 domain-containing protein [Sneathiella sedimenti]
MHLDKLCVILIILMFFWTGPTRAQEETKVGVELVLLADATGSIDDAEILFQREGYAKAITDQNVISAIKTTIYERIAVTYVEWGDSNSQDIVVGWRIIDSQESAQDFAKELRSHPRKARGYNAIGTALLFGKNLIETNNIWGFRRVIDISADSANNWSGPPIEFARQEIVNAGITINGLAILCRHCSGRPNSYDLELAFRTQIIGGDGAFVITADNAATFADAVRKKLILEIAETTLENMELRN